MRMRRSLSLAAAGGISITALFAGAPAGSAVGFDGYCRAEEICVFATSWGWNYPRNTAGTYDYLHYTQYRHNFYYIRYKWTNAPVNDRVMSSLNNDTAGGLRFYPAANYGGLASQVDYVARFGFCTGQDAREKQYCYYDESSRFGSLYSSVKIGQ